MADKDTFASATVDETLQLWTKMWEADHVHDQTIVANVQALLTRAVSLVDALQHEIAALPSGGGGGVADGVDTFSRCMLRPPERIAGTQPKYGA